jgi:hypothetical protein
MDPLEDPLKTCPIETGREMSIEPYPNRQFGFIDNPDPQFHLGSVPTRTRTQSDGPEPLLTLDINQRVTYTLPPTQRRSINTPVATLGKSYRSTSADRGTSTRRIVSSLTSRIFITPTSLRGLENLPTPIPNAEARTMITKPLRTQSNANQQGQRP